MLANFYIDTSEPGLESSDLLVFMSVRISLGSVGSLIIDTTIITSFSISESSSRTLIRLVNIHLQIFLDKGL